jgi:hypothetical protein
MTSNIPRDLNPSSSSTPETIYTVNGQFILFISFIIMFVCACVFFYVRHWFNTIVFWFHPINIDLIINCRFHPFNIDLIINCRFHPINIDHIINCRFHPINIDLIIKNNCIESMTNIKKNTRTYKHNDKRNK